MAKTMRAHDDLKRNSADMEAANHYVRTRLGRNGGDTFLTELSPIPSAKTADKVWMATIQRPRPENRRQNQAAKRGAKGNAGHKHSVFSRVLWQATKGICDTVWMLNGRSSSRVGVLPPNSRPSRLRCWAALAEIVRPVTVLPVKLITGTSGEVNKRFPASRFPMSISTTPAGSSGRPLMISLIRRLVCASWRGRS